MNLNTTLRASKDVLATDVGGEAVLMHVERGIYYGLNELGAVVWKRLDAPVSVAALCEAVTDEFAVDRETCEHDVLKLLAELKDAGLVEETDS
jgi:hypothetical protein